MSTANDNHLDILLAANAGLISKLEPTQESRQRMLTKIMQAVEPKNMLVVRHAEGRWHEILPGVSIKILRESADESSQTTLWRLQAGAKVPRHKHSRDEECLVLEGSITHAGTEYYPGDYLLTPAGVDHDYFVAPAGALFLIRGEILDKAMVI